MMCPTHFLSICRIFTKILLDMFSCENSIYCRLRQIYFAQIKIYSPYKRQFDIKKTNFKRNSSFLMQVIRYANYLLASSTATATATVIPTMGLLPAPMRPIISTCAGTEEEPANCASPCIRPIVSVIP